MHKRTAIYKSQSEAIIKNPGNTRGVGTSFWSLLRRHDVPTRRPTLWVRPPRWQLKSSFITATSRDVAWLCCKFLMSAAFLRDSSLLPPIFHSKLLWNTNASSISIESKWWRQKIFFWDYGIWCHILIEDPKRCPHPKNYSSELQFRLKPTTKLERFIWGSIKN